MSELLFSELEYMDRQSSRACAIQLKAWVKRLHCMRPDLDGDVAHYADALMIKLAHGIDCEQEQTQMRAWIFEYAVGEQLTLPLDSH